MKDIIITRKRQKTELLVLLACFVIACLANLYAILTYGGKLSELFTSLGYVLVFTAALYVAFSVLRLIVAAIRMLIRKKKQK